MLDGYNLNIEGAAMKRQPELPPEKKKNKASFSTWKELFDQDPVRVEQKKKNFINEFFDKNASNLPSTISLTVAKEMIAKLQSNELATLYQEVKKLGSGKIKADDIAKKQQFVDVINKVVTAAQPSITHSTPPPLRE